jgi:ribosomal protein L28
MKQCEMCSKGSQMQGARKLLRGHYNPVNWSRKHPNIQTATVDGKKMQICTGCIRTLHKPARTIKKAAAPAAQATAAAK